MGSEDQCSYTERQDKLIDFFILIIRIPSTIQKLIIFVTWDKSLMCLVEQFLCTRYSLLEPLASSS